MCCCCLCAHLQPDVHVNAAAWDMSALPAAEEGEEGGGEGGGEGEEEEDAMWADFKSKEEQKRLQVGG